MRECLRMESVSRIYGGRREPIVPAVRSASLVVARGEIALIEGPSGSGKTTLLAVAGLLLPPTKGAVTVDGRPTHGMRPPELVAFRRATIGFVFQRGLLVESLTAVENVEVALQAAGIRRPESRRRALGLLERFSAGHLADRRPATLSGGERQRIALARAFANDPVLLLADEPTGSLDAATGRSVMTALAQAALEAYAAVVVVSHDARIRPIATVRYTLEDGRLEPETREGGTGRPVAVPADVPLLPESP